VEQSANAPCTRVAATQGVKTVFWIFITALLLAVIGACSSDPYRYIPATNRATNPREAIYIVPSGTMRVQWAAIDDVKVQKDQPEVKTVHLRLIASNHSKNGDWTIDPSDFFVSFASGDQVRPLVTDPKILTVRPGELSAMDLFFPLPPSLKSSDDIREFDFHWNAQTADQKVVETTPFDRIKIEQYSAYSPYYWGGPIYPSYSAGVGVAWGR
jgi:hypothetical protein